MTTFTLILFLTLPTGEREMVVERTYFIKSACEKQARKWSWENLLNTDGYVDKAICLRNVTYR